MNLIYTPKDRMGWWGGQDTRPRCIQDDKVAFDTKERAERSALKASERGTPMNSYKGKCGLYHVTRIKK